MLATRAIVAKRPVEALIISVFTWWSRCDAGRRHADRPSHFCTAVAIGSAPSSNCKCANGPCAAPAGVRFKAPFRSSLTPLHPGRRWTCGCSEPTARPPGKHMPRMIPGAYLVRLGIILGRGSRLNGAKVVVRLHHNSSDRLLFDGNDLSSADLSAAFKEHSRVCNCGCFWVVEHLEYGVALEPCGEVVRPEALHPIVDR